MTPLPVFPPALELSYRENEILSLIAEGLSNIEISRRLGIAVSTVKNHSTSIYRKLDVRDRANAIIFVWQNAYTRLENKQYEQYE